jgi:1-acyl-sn-glycerol-3-phosphate acyltransferase
MWFMGCYPAKNPRGKHKIFGVDGAAQLLSHGFSISIFPEGRRVRNEQRGEAKQGVIRIHQAAPNVPFILAHIEYNHGIKAWIARRRRVITYKLVPNPSYDNPEIIMDEIFAL